MALDKIIEKMNRDEEFFLTYGLSGIKSRAFQRNNFIIGENGAGKSRLLTAVKEYVKKEFENDNKNTILYLDFTLVKPRYIPTEGEIKDHSFNDTILYNRLTSNLVENLVEVIEEGFSNFFEEFALIAKHIRNDILKKINDKLEPSLKRRLRMGDSKYWEISRRGSKPVTFLPLKEEIEKMSPGERTLLYFVLGVETAAGIANYLHNDLIIFIDEPETHLHPNALLAIINQLTSSVGYKYLFIATHSVFLIPHFKFEELFFISNSCIIGKSSKIYKNLYGNLIGYPTEESKSLYDFLGSEFEWEYVSYISECFLAPENVDEASPKDKQADSLRQFVQTRINELKVDGAIEKLNILDYGAGSGRIGRCINERIKLYPDEVSSQDLQKYIKYSVYDKYIVEHEFVNNNKISFLDKILTFEELPHYKGHFDILLLFNVLHEIDITEWKEALETMISLLKSDGYIVFSERRVLSKGEKPYGKSGYLVLDKNELETLFGTAQIIEYPIGSGNDERKDIVSCCIVYKKDYSGIIKTANILSSIKKLSERCMNEIEGRLATKSNISAREYAFYCQQYFNARHALEMLKGISNVENIEQLSYVDIIKILDKDEMIRCLKERARVDDYDGRKCKAHLKEYCSEESKDE